MLDCKPFQKMNDVDSVTTKKVDTVMRQGDKAVILKINGDKKASKKLFFY